MSRTTCSSPLFTGCVMCQSIPRITTPPLVSTVCWLCYVSVNTKHYHPSPAGHDCLLAVLCLSQSQVLPPLPWSPSCTVYWLCYVSVSPKYYHPWSPLFTGCVMSQSIPSITIPPLVTPGHVTVTESLGAGNWQGVGLSL